MLHEIPCIVLCEFLFLQEVMAFLCEILWGTMSFQSCKNEIIVEQSYMSVCLYIYMCVCMCICIIIITMCLIWLPRSSYPILHWYVLCTANYNLQYNSSSPDIVSWKYLSTNVVWFSQTQVYMSKFLRDVIFVIFIVNWPSAKFQLPKFHW